MFGCFKAREETPSHLYVPLTDLYNYVSIVEWLHITHHAWSMEILSLFSLLGGGRMEKEIAFCDGGCSVFFHHVLPEVQDEWPQGPKRNRMMGLILRVADQLRLPLSYFDVWTLAFTKIMLRVQHLCYPLLIRIYRSIRSSPVLNSSHFFAFNC